MQLLTVIEIHFKISSTGFPHFFCSGLLTMQHLNLQLAIYFCSIPPSFSIVSLSFSTIYL